MRDGNERLVSRRSLLSGAGTTLGISLAGCADLLSEEETNTSESPTPGDGQGRNVRILLTNDDGIESVGIEAVYQALSSIADVTVVAPPEDVSGIGRARTIGEPVSVETHEWGYVVDGTPADCVSYGLRGLDTDFDLVVSGCNSNPNIGTFVAGISGTVGACWQSAALGTPGLAVSAYHPEQFLVRSPEEHTFENPATAASELVRRGIRTSDGNSLGIFEDVDILNVNVPLELDDPTVRQTELIYDYEAAVAPATDTDTENDVLIPPILWPNTDSPYNPYPNQDALRERYPVGTERRAVVDREVAVSPLDHHVPSVETALFGSDGSGESLDGVDIDRQN